MAELGRLLAIHELLFGKTPPGEFLPLDGALAAEVDELYARVVEAGFHGEKEPWDAFWGYRYAQLGDPDGVGVDLFAAL